MVRLLTSAAVSVVALAPFATADTPYSNTDAPQFTLHNRRRGNDVIGPQAAASNYQGKIVGYDGGAGCTPLEDTIEMTIRGKDYTLSKRTSPCRGTFQVTEGSTTTTESCPTDTSTTYEDKSKVGHQLVMTMICKSGFWSANGLLVDEEQEEAVSYSLTVDDQGVVAITDENSPDDIKGSTPVTCGEVVQNSGRRLTDSIQKEDVHFHPINAPGRKLKYDWFDDCFEGQEQLSTLSIGVTVGEALFRDLDRNMKTTRQFVDSIINKSNKMYEGNFNIRLVLGHLVVKPDFNPTCSDKTQGQLDKLRSWKKPSVQAMWQHLDDCFGSDGNTAGLAYVGTICGGDWATGVNWKSTGLFGQTWKTFAHEVGHNFGAQHTFEEGKGSTGGIMDYGGFIRGYTGGWNGEVQFNEKYRREDICTDLRKKLPQCARAKTFMALNDEENPWYEDGSNGVERTSVSNGVWLISLAPAVTLMSRMF